MVGEIIIWIIGAIGLLLLLGGWSAGKANENDIRECREKIAKAKPWDSTDVWEKMLADTEKANAGAAIMMFIGGFLMLLPIVMLLGKWGIL